MMKKLTMIFVAMLSCIMTYAQTGIQDKDVPAVVSAALLAKYPDAKTLKWFIDSTSNYIGNFSLKAGKYNYAVTLEAGGNIIKTESDIDVADLPPTIITYLNANYPKVQINKAKRTDIIIDNKGVVLYTVELQNKVAPLVFDVNGNLLQ